MQTSHAPRLVLSIAVPNTRVLNTKVPNTRAHSSEVPTGAHSRTAMDQITNCSSQVRESKEVEAEVSSMKCPSAAPKKVQLKASLTG